MGATTNGHPFLAAIYDAFMFPQELSASAGSGLHGRSRDRQRPRARRRHGPQPAPLRERREVVGIDPDPHMLRRAQRRAEKAPCPVRLVEADAQDLPFGEHEFDTVVVTLSFCTIPDPAAAVAEARRVLKPDGRFLFLEHVRSERPWVARLQRGVTPAWKRVAGGCHLNRSTVATIEGEFELERIWRKGVLVQGAARPRD